MVYAVFEEEGRGQKSPAIHEMEQGSEQKFFFSSPLFLAATFREGEGENFRWRNVGGERGKGHGQFFCA